jgi:ParB family chromosome partitioning protein
MPKPNHKPKGETAMSANHTTINEYRNLPITMLVESATNPRRRFNEDNLRELAESFQSQGILAPLLVRELEE